MLKQTLFVALGVACLASCPLSAATESGTSPEAPAYWPVCNAPQPIAPATMPAPSDPLINIESSSVAWNGAEFAVVWNNGSNLKFRRFFADGTPAAPESILSGATSNFQGPKIVWNGTGYAVAWMQFTSTLETRLLLLDRLGAPLGPATLLGTLGTGTSVNSNFDLAWNGAQYAAVWVDYRNGNRDIYGAVVNAAGVLIVGDLAVFAGASDQSNPTIVWSPIAGQFIAIWDDIAAVPNVIRSKTISTAGALGTVQTLITPPSGNAFQPHALQVNGNLALVWSDSRSGPPEVQFQRLDANGVPFGSPTPVTASPAVGQHPFLVWTGAEFAAFWADNRAGSADIWMQRIAASGALIGGNVQISSSYTTGAPAAAFARYGFLVSGVNSGGGSFGRLQLFPIGCALDTTLPVCGSGYVAYNITGATATIAWTPGDDTETDLAYYNIYRNGTLAGQTSATVFSDLGPLGLSTTYAYTIQPVNAAQMRNAACSQVLYLKTNASLTLTLNKSNPHTVLNWTDAGLSDYSVFRGNSPQVMQQIGSTPALTTQDANALNDNLNYFYTVDDPGQ